jgi:hypothetical protein
MAGIIEKAEDYMSSARYRMMFWAIKLSEFLAVERGRLRLYELALQIVTDTTVSQKFRELPWTNAQAWNYSGPVISALGMDPDYVSAAATVAEQKATTLQNTMMSADGLPKQAWKSTRSQI